MALSYDLISQFAKLAVGDKKTKSESTVYGTVVVDGNGNKYVKLDNSDQLTPLAEDNQPTLESTSADANEGERVSVLIKDHKATVTGNISSPAARTGDVADVKDSVSKIQEFDILVGERLQANEAYIKELQTDKADVGDLTAATAKITELEASKASVDELNATKAEITDIKATKLDVDIANIKYATIENLNVVNEEVTNIKGLQAEYQELTTDNFEAVDATIKNLDTKYASIETLEAEQARITKLETDSLTAESATIKNLEADVGNIDTLIFGSASGDVIQSSFANAVIAQLGNAQIKAAMIENVNADQITAGDILTNNVRVMSEDGKLLISDETIQISDDERVRVQIGKDASGDYSISIWDADGNLMFSEGGITDNAIKDAIIRNDMVSEDANISASKLNISSLFSEINNSTETIKSTKIYLDDEKQTLDVAFTSMSSEVGDLSDTVSSQGTELSVIQGKIESKVWQQDIDDATDTLNDQYSILEQTVDNISMTVGSHETILNDAMLAPKIEGNGTPVVKVTNALGNSIDNLKFYGKTTQKSFSGKNLLPYPYTTADKTTNGITITVQDDGGIKVVGTATGDVFFELCHIHFSDSDLRAHVASKKTDGNVVISGGDSSVRVYYDSNNSTTYLYIPTGNTINTVVYPQIELGTTATEYEPYVGGVPSPNPDYPQSLDSIGMDGSIDYRVCGKNLVPYPYAVNGGTYKGVTFTDNGDGSITLNGTATGNIYYDLMNVGSADFGPDYIGTNASGTKVKNGYAFSLVNGNADVFLVYQASNGALFIQVNLGTTLENVTVYPQIELGTTATEYEPYVGSQISSVATPDGLRGIPVSSGGTRTDANGQHWICDEIDLKRGVYIQRIGKYTLTGTESWKISSNTVNNGVRFDCIVSGYPTAAIEDVLSSHCVYSGINKIDTSIGMNMWVAAAQSALKPRIVLPTGSTVETLTTFLQEEKTKGTPVEVLYALNTPIETPLDAETLATFSSITNEPGTVIAIAESDIDVELSEIASNRAVETTAANIRETITEQNTSILSTCESIVLSATESVVKTDEFNTYKDTAKAEMELMSDNIGFKFSETSDRIDATNESLNDEITERNKHILFDQNGITIQAGENNLKLHLDNDMIYFEKNGVEFGFWDGVDFHTGNIIVNLEERAQFGNFAYIPRKDGSLSFLKVADTAGFYVRLLNGILRMYGTNSTLEDATLNISDVSGTLTETTLILGGV